MTTASALTKPAQIRVAQRSAAYWRVTIDNPPINVMGPEMLRQFQEVIAALEADEQVIRAEQAEAYGYINRALPDADLDAFVEALATRIAGFDKWAIANTKRLVNTSLPPDVEIGAGWDACIASLGRPAAQNGIKALMARGFHKPGDVENRLGYYLGQIAR